jgi:hypothetical protein
MLPETTYVGGKKMLRRLLGFTPMVSGSRQ